MFFIISKFISLFLKPIVLVAIFMGMALVISNPRLKKIFLGFSFFILLIFGNRVISSKLLQSLEYDPVLFEDLDNYEYGIVLTGITDPVMQPRDRVYINYGADRVFHTIQLYRMGIIKKILITGNNGLYPQNTTTEAEELKQVFELSKIPSRDIVLETKAKNTRENAIFSKKVLDAMGVRSKSLLITSAFHMRRADHSFTKAGILHDVFPTNFYGSHVEYSWDHYILPSEDALGLWVMIIHELIGDLVYKVMGYS